MGKRNYSHRQSFRNSSNEADLLGSSSFASAILIEWKIKDLSFPKNKDGGSSLRFLWTH